VTQLLGASLLARSFYERDAQVVARELLNKLIVVEDPGCELVAARIVEVEAYRGCDDAASHAARGQTARNASMFGPPGRLYVYFTYGMHWCMNVVCGAVGDPQAVLLRAAEPINGCDTMRQRRPRAHTDRDLCRGPARLTQALGVTGADDGASLLSGRIRIFADANTPPSRPARTTRIGIRSAQEKQWRWFVRNSAAVSGRA